MSYYYTARICLNGHLITDCEELSDRKGTFCPQCGEGTITSCPRCEAPIPGDYYCEGVLSIHSDFVHPAYCANCGEAFPWTIRALQAAAALILEDEGADETTKDRLMSSLPDLVAETAGTPIAKARMKKYLSSTGAFVRETLKEILIHVVSESVKTSLGI